MWLEGFRKESNGAWRGRRRVGVFVGAWSVNNHLRFVVI